MNPNGNGFCEATSLAGPATPAELTANVSISGAESRVTISSLPVLSKPICREKPGVASLVSFWTDPGIGVIAPAELNVKPAMLVLSVLSTYSSLPWMVRLNGNAPSDDVWPASVRLPSAATWNELIVLLPALAANSNE